MLLTSFCQTITTSIYTWLNKFSKKDKNYTSAVAII